MHYSAAMRQVSESQGRKHRWLAKQLGMSPSHLCNVLAGRRTAPPDFWARIAALLGVPEEMIRPEEREVVVA